MNRQEKFKNLTTMVCYILELIAAVFVLVGIVMAIIALVPQVGEYWQAREETEALMHFLEQVFAVVIGVEFLKMLCRPNSDNILETLIFLVARHMIIVTTTTPLEDLISTISIVLLCLVRRYLKQHRTTEPTI
jgi:uncharacterized membrane protein (DUF373 family)